MLYMTLLKPFPVLKKCQIRIKFIYDRCEKELGCIENAHDGMIWDLKWHPLGHILCTGSNDHTTYVEFYLCDF